MFLLHRSRKKWLKEGNSFAGEKEEESIMKANALFSLEGLV